MKRRIKASQDEVLDDFISDWTPDNRALQDYVKLYPAFGPALLDLHYQLQMQVADAERAAARPTDEAWIAASWDKFLAVAAVPTPTDPFAAAKGARFAAVRHALGVRAATLMGFRDRCVDVASVPAAFLVRLASALAVRREDLERFLALPPRVASVQSFRADVAPEPPATKVSFEALLLSAKEDAETRARLLERDG